MRPAAALTVLLSLLLAGCGGSGEDTVAEPEGDQTLEELWRQPGDDVAVVAGTANHEPGEVRVSFLVTDREGRVALLPTAHVWVSKELEAKPFLESTAKLERIGVPGGAEADATHIYVARVRLPDPGTYWLLAEPEGGPKIQALGNVVVSAEDPEPGPGDPAPPPRRRRSRRPEATSRSSRRGRLPTSCCSEHSVADSLRDGVPFVVTFSTPKFCSSRTCGPVVDVVEDVAKRYEDEDVRFIHVEVYEENDPAKGFNRFMQEWSLETEPWTFVVGADGKIVERFEGAVSVLELEEALERLPERG